MVFYDITEQTVKLLYSVMTWKILAIPVFKIAVRIVH